MHRILYILIAIVMLGFIIMMHEFGHYIMGRICGIGIVEFSIGMGPKIVGFKRKGIQYSLRAIPLGGYCAFVGEDEDNSAKNAMNNQPVWKRILTVVSGPLMNFLLAFVFCAILLANFIVAEYQPKVAQVIDNTPAAECGFEAGDIVISANGTEISFDQAGITTVQEIILENGSEAPVDLVVERDGERVDISVQPAEVVVNEETGETGYQVGIAFAPRTYKFGEALGASCGYMVDFTKEMLKALKNLVFKGEGVNDMMGPVGIVSFVSELVYNEKAYAVVYLIFMLSLNIGIMNLLPLPALDGGRLIFLIVEGIIRKPVPREKEGLIHAIGMGLLILLIIFITYKDIVRLITGG
ncbi:MAG: site-2 protease family protein [Clostridia bacterium]|nr:site-2 protease family protein [Clostridia bacterium]